ncbi:MAG TPA: flippase [Candidatus Omnitrophica bacterium]|nr:flippase [Candidatus Omnitrophota bacterium]
MNVQGAEHNIHSQIVERLIKEVARGGIIAFLGLLFGRFLHFILHVLVGHVLGPASYGLYALGLSVIGIVRSIASLGLNQGVVRFGSIYRGEGDISRLKGIIISALVISLVVSIFFTIILFIFSGTIAHCFFHNVELTWVFRIFSLALPFYVLMGITASFCRSFKRISYQQGIENFFHPLLSLVLVSLAFLLGFRLSGVIYGFLISGFFSACLSFYFLKKIFPESYRVGLKPSYEIKNLLNFCLPLIFVGLSYFLMVNIDRIMLGFFATSRDVGLYASASVIASQILIIHSALVIIFAPVAADLYHRHSSVELDFIYKTVTRWDVVISVVICVIVSLFSRELLSLYGPRFVNASYALLILLVAHVLSAAAGPTGILLQMSGRQKLELFNAAVLIICNILLNIILIPRYGIIGAAIATMFAFLFLNIMQLFQIKLILGVSPFNAVYFYQVGPIVVLGVVINASLLINNIITYKFIGSLLFLIITTIVFSLTKTKEDTILLASFSDWVMKRLRRT